jgi:N6-L-threonylcarbamoyladenine synthase
MVVSLYVYAIRVSRHCCIPGGAVPNLAAAAAAAAAAAGEAYDKVARMLGLELKPNGGAALEAIARHGNPDAFPFGVPMKKYGNCDFSYAGLKTSVRLCIEKHLGSAEGAGKRATVTLQQQQAAAASNGGSSSSSSSDSAADDQQQQQLKADIAASFQKVAVQHLVMRLKRALTWAREESPELQHLVVAGGVASNQYVRQQVLQVRHGGLCFWRAFW